MKSQDGCEKVVSVSDVEVVAGEHFIMWPGGVHGCRDCLHPTSTATGRHGGTLHDYDAW